MSLAKHCCLVLYFTLFTCMLRAQPLRTVFEVSGGKETITYPACIDWYRRLAASSPKVKMLEMGMTDAGYPLHLVICSGDGNTDPASWDRKNKIVILLNNGIHPGEPDGIEATMMLLRDVATGKWKLPDHVILAAIPVYNIGGALNRNSHSRVNQDGPAAYGFRGNAQNLDLNRDFTKCDSREARSFAAIFHLLDPDILVDNHVSDGADYQHVMTLLSTQYDKLGGAAGTYQRRWLDPSLYKKMRQTGYPMIPYVNAEDTPDKGWVAFYDPPRFSSGYAALFQCMAYVTETHMLKPFAQRVTANLAFLRIIATEAGKRSNAIIAAKAADRAQLRSTHRLALHWKPDSSSYTRYAFRGYKARYKPSEVTGMPRLYYDRTAPFEKSIPIYDFYKADKTVTVPYAYVVPRGWQAVADLLALNGVQLQELKADTVLELTAYHIDNYQTMNRAYEKHYKHYDIKATPMRQTIGLHKGDYIVYTDQPGKRFIAEMLEPEGEDSYFAWNFFDAVLQQKEGYSDYRWEDVAAAFLKQHPEVRQALEAKKQADASFAKNAQAQLYFVYQHSPYYEPQHLRYPVYRLE